MQGKIIKGIGGFYYVYCKERIYECRAKGLFRKDKIKPLVGDNTEFEILDEEKAIGNVTGILPRKSLLVRPAVANVDQALVVFAAAVPEPNLNLLDRFLLMMRIRQVETVICFNKLDIVTDDEINRLLGIYHQCDSKAFAVSSREDVGMEKILQVLEGKTTVLAGPSGVGKSSVVNHLYPTAKMETGAVSEKIGRGKHTTRHSELFCIGKDSSCRKTFGSWKRLYIFRIYLTVYEFKPDFQSRTKPLPFAAYAKFEFTPYMVQAIHSFYRWLIGYHILRTTQIEFIILATFLNKEVGSFANIRWVYLEMGLHKRMIFHINKQFTLVKRFTDCFPLFKGNHICQTIVYHSNVRMCIYKRIFGVSHIEEVRFIPYQIKQER